MSNPIADSASIHRSAAWASSIGSSVVRARSAASRAAVERALAVASCPSGVAAQHRRLGPLDRIGAVGEQRRHAVAPPRGVLVGGDVEGMTPSGERGGDPLGAVGQGARLDEVVGEGARRRLRLARLLEGVGEAAVQVEAAGTAQAGDHGLADQGVRHGEPARSVLHQESRREGGVDGVEQAISVESARPLEDGQRGRGAGDRGEVEHMGHGPVEPIETHTHHRPDGFGELATERCPVAVADELGEEEGVAASRRVELTAPARCPAHRRAAVRPRRSWRGR